jgi:hypothetical protein
MSKTLSSIPSIGRKEKEEKMGERVKKITMMACNSSIQEAEAGGS